MTREGPQLAAAKLKKPHARLACAAMMSAAHGLADKLEARPSVAVPGNDVRKPQAAFSLPAAASTEPVSTNQECSPAASDLSKETLPLGFWDTEARDMEVEEDWHSTMKHNPPREVMLAKTDWMLSQKDGACHCQWVQYCGKWELWTCNYHRWQESEKK